MSFKVLHRGYQHIRLSSSFSLTLDIQDYLRSLARDEKGIESIQFYMDQQHFTLRIKEGFSVLDNAEAFLKRIDKGKVSELMTLPIRREESAYSIVSGAAVKRVLFRSFVPYPIRYIWTCYQALGYIREAYQTLARKELTMEILDCSAILLSLFMNQSKTASNIMFMLDLGNHLDQWSLKKTATDLEQSLLAKESDVFLVQGDTVVSIKSSDVQIGDVLILSQGNEILFDGQVVSGLGMVNESSLTGSFSKAISFLLVDFSCALKISTPVAYLTVIKEGLNREMVIKDGDVLEKYLEVDTFLFDKTGTITTSYPIVEKVLPFGDYSEEDILRISACLEEHIYHPIANAIVKQAEIEGIEHEEMHGKLQYIASKGIKSHIDGQPVLIGNYVLMQDEQIHISSEQNALIEEYKSHYNLLFLAYQNELIGMFCIHTPLRKEAKTALDKLKAQGKKLILATGDTLIRTEELVKDLPFDQVYTDLKPDGKFELVEKLQKAGHTILMVGDGLNDSAALTLSDIGVVMNESADISKQMSDILLLDNRLDFFQELDSLSSSLQTLIKKNIQDTVVVNSSLIGFGLFNWLSPSNLSILHNLTTLRIVLRSLSIKNR
ncbi:TPA: HAD-IC family P-type ATPase [Streptococcus pneumoniae]